jgi:prepilin-type N-terminal cleavage/methylation domain-containing protein
MFQKNSSQNGFSLVEILIALALLGVLSGTIFHAFTSVTPLSPTNQSKAYNLGREGLENLYGAVRQDTWDAGNLRSGVNQACVGPASPTSLDGTNFSCNYTVSSVAGGPDYRKVDVVVSW